VCYVLNHSFPYSNNGYAVRSHGIAAALARRGFSVVGVNRPGSPWDLPGFAADRTPGFHDLDGVRYVFTRGVSSGNHSSPEWQAQTTEVLTGLFRVFRPSAVLAASNWENALPAQRAASGLGLAFFYEVRGFWELSRASHDAGYSQSEQYRRTVTAETQVALSAQRVFTLNRIMRDELIDRGVPAARIDVVPNAYGALPPLPSKAAASPNAIASRHTVGYVGSFSDYEGLDDLVHAVHGLRASGLDVSLLLVGSSNPSGVLDSAQPCSTTQSLRALAGRLGIGEHVHFAGRVAPAALAAHYAHLDLFVMPRRPVAVCELVSPIKPLEAAAYGCPMLCSDVAPLAEMAPEAGFALFRKGDVEDLQRRMAELLRDPARRAEMSLKARRWVTDERQFTHVVQPMVDALRNGMTPTGLSPHARGLGPVSAVTPR
jgi:glycosyltransferase involved in cell wall biosynthesis